MEHRTADESGQDDDYPSTFTPQFIRHCREGSIPPALFKDLQSHAHCFPRYVRIHPARVALFASGPLSEKSETSTRSASASEDLLRRGLAARLGLPMTAVTPVSWLPCDGFAIPGDYPLRRNAHFTSGDIIPMDAASMAAVVALRPRRGDRVLDLCCSPGMKLNLIADAIGPAGSSSDQRQKGDNMSTGLVVGVDISVDRLFVARSLVRKHQWSSGHYQNPQSVCLVAADGCTVSTQAVRAAMDVGERSVVKPAVGLTAHEERRLRSWRNGAPSGTSKRRREEGAAKAAAAHVTPDVALVYASPEARRALLSSWDGLFEGVLVDAECSHDGSLRHLALDDGVDRSCTTPSRADVTDERLHGAGGLSNTYRMQRIHTEAASGDVGTRCGPDGSSLLDLQLRLLLKGYSQLRPGGTLVYCTCSFSYLQNEHVVSTFLTTVNNDTTAPAAVECKAVLVPAFSYEHEEGSGTLPADRGLAPCMRFGTDSSCTAQSLQARLDSCRDPYGIVRRGREQASEALPTTGGSQNPSGGSRFYPLEFHTSFQYVAKIWKQPLAGSGTQCCASVCAPPHTPYPTDAD